MATEFEFGISLASLLPHSMTSAMWSGSALNIAARLKIAGYRFFQTLPLRGVTGFEWFCRPEWSWYKENAWNAVDGFFQAFFHHNGEAMEPSRLEDWVIFPEPCVCDQVFQRLAGWHISHDFGKDLVDRLVEIKPEHELSASALARKAETEGYELVFDTEHALEDRRGGVGSPFGQTTWDRIDAIDEYARLVRVVHLKGTNGDHQQAIRRLLASPHLKKRIDVVVEFRPDPRMSEDQAIARARQFLASAKNLFRAAW